MENLLLMMMFCASKGLYIKKKKKPIIPNNTTFQKDTQILTFEDGIFFLVYKSKLKPIFRSLHSNLIYGFHTNNPL